MATEIAICLSRNSSLSFGERLNNSYLSLFDQIIEAPAGDRITVVYDGCNFDKRAG